MLVNGPRAGDPRHQTLEACLRWSFDALNDADAAVLRRLSVFAGGATLDAAVSVCAGEDLDPYQVEDSLVSLVDKSLVVGEERGLDLRYRLHELVRQFAAARLEEAGESTESRDRHLLWCTELVHAAPRGCEASRQ